MKKLYSLFTFLFAFLLFQAQVTKEIPLPYSTAGYAENTTSASSNKNIPNVLIPSVNAEMNVNESGALTYTLPIETVKGLRSFQPNIALVYNSQSANGQAGWGWNIVGLSSITQGGKSKEIDGITIGVQFNNTDPYYLDGQRLIKISETNYVTEKFSKLKITQFASGEFSFIIQYPDGKIAKYKELVSGQHYISVLIDSFNNEVHYSYQVENNIPNIIKISYGGTTPANDKFDINFLYKARKKNIQIFRNGIAYTSSKILYEINSGTTYTSPSLYRKYILSHDFIEDNSVERLRNIAVSNEHGEALKPLNFNYNTTNQGSVKIISHIQVGITGGNFPGSGTANSVTGLGSVTMGDFLNKDPEKIQPVFQTRLTNGYGLKVGAVAENPSITIENNNSGTLLFSGKVLDLNNKITEKDQLINVYENITGSEDPYNPNSPGNQQLKDEVVFQIKSLVTGEERKIRVPVKGGLIEVQNYIPPDPYDNYGSGTYETTYTRDNTRRDYIQGDFNNDGLVDFLIIEPRNVNRNDRIYWAEIGKANSGTSVELNPILLNETSIPLYNKDVYPIEFDGDGLPELLAVDKNNSKYSVYKIDFTTNSLNIKISNQTLSNFGSDTPIFLGDFNGDGLTDFLTPQNVYAIPEDDSSGVKMGDTYYRMQTETLLWWKYTGNGVSFVKNQEDYTQQKIAYLKPAQSNYIKRSTFWQKFWNGKPDEYAYTRYSTHNIIITDFNNDGRSDIITLNKIGSAKYNVNGSLSNVPINNLSNSLSRMTSPHVYESFNSDITNRMNFYENKNLQGGTFQKLTTYSIENTKISPLSLIVSATNFDYLNTSKSGVYIYDPLGGDSFVYAGASTNITIDNSNFLEKQIQEVNNGTEVVQRVDYRNMIASPDTTESTYLYKAQDFKYPYYIHQTNPILYMAHKIHTVFDGKTLTKEYRYENGIQHLIGKGFLGFQKTYSSDAYESEIKNGKYVNKNPGKAVFWNIQTSDPEMDNATVKSTYGGINKFFTENTIINKKFDKGNHQYLVLSTDEVSKDYLKKITIGKKYEYDENDDLKLKTAYTDYSGAGSSISKYTYKPEFFNTDHYFYGKIASVENAVYKDGLSFITKEEHAYFPNGEVSENKKYGNQPNAPPILNSYTYDSIGNLKTQTGSVTGISPQTTTYEYDVTNRYLNKTITPDALFATINVNALGRASSEASSLGLMTSYAYDSWGNVNEITDFLGKKTTISKSVADVSTGGVYNLHKKREGGTETIVTFDKFDREIQAKTQSINGKWLVSKTEYDLFGRKIKISEPFFEGEPAKWNTVEYDELNRPVKNTSFTGKVITTCYEGLKVTVEDGYKKTSKTLDAMGHTIRQQDHGGVLSFSYYPNGALRETNYEGIKTTFEIDGWGNKTKITDPSAGNFTYEYDNLSRITKETNPKGYTLYSYDDLGRPLAEKTYGNTPAENTTIEKNYTYNGQTKLPETITGTSNGKTFTYTTYYDQYYRIKGKKEETPDFTYTSSTTFDSFGRAEGVNMYTLISNYSSTSSIKNVYDSNGILIQQNNDNGTMVWHVSDINSRGQTTQMEYGNGFTITSQYNPNDFSLFNIRHQNTNNGTLALDIDYNYDVNKGVLNSRRNNIFGKKEDFTYDKLNRLLSEAVNDVLTNEYTYDKRGRITSNTELGKYNYNETDYKLQKIDFNTNGQNVNSQRGFAHITYNAFKSPLRIQLAGKEDLNFEYNILNGRYSMSSSVTGRTKFYSSDFAVEITRKPGPKGSGEIEIITYITGDPYSANYIKKEIVKAGLLQESDNYYLHRDNLGSILAITKTDGSVVEKRFFDAWGNLKSLVDESGQLITDSQQLATGNLFLDRGYTGHEHLWKAGLINMNARLYDPILRKFLSPDNMVQDPFNTQNYDRFGYVYNNPLLYVDLDGNEITLGLAVVIGVAVAITTKVIVNMISGIPFWYGLGKSALMGAVSGAISFGIGSAATSFFQEGLSIGKALFEAGMHALSGGAMSAIDGGKFGAGALSSAISSLMASSVQALGTDFGATKAAGRTVYNSFGKDLMKATMIVTGGLSGGISSAIAGGSFWDGFKQGLITSGLNHTAHIVRDGFDRSNYDKLRNQVEKIMGDAEAKFSGNPSDMWKMMNEVPILKELLNKLHGTKIWATVLKNHPDSDKFNGKTESNGDGSISIKLYLKKYTTNIAAALTLGHEITHAIGKVNGSEAMWAGMIRADAGSKVIKNYIVHQSEVGAYMWSATYADSQRTFDWKVSQSNQNMYEASILLRDFGK
ncbi:RHS repeat-associated core domain-containing protein [Chryseobacterium herbae]|nr:RHS repeat-associated core domain-containing protein [Chryseobacterium sp. pc1-10]